MSRIHGFLSAIFLSFTATSFAAAPSEYYFRTAATFDAPRGSKYEWLNESIFVTTAERLSDLVIVHFYRIL